MSGRRVMLVGYSSGVPITQRQRHVWSMCSLYWAAPKQENSSIVRLLTSDQNSLVTHIGPP